MSATEARSPARRVRLDPRRRRSCEARLSWRLPLIGGWFRRRAAEALARDGSPESSLALAMAVTRRDDPRVFAIAMAYLEGLEDQDGIDIVCSAWAASRHPALGRLQAERRWVASGPVRVRVLSALAADRPEVVTRGDAAVVAPLIEACDDRDPSLAVRARAALGGLESPDTIDELCSLWASQRGELLDSVVTGGGLVARGPIEVRVVSALKTGRLAVLESLGAEGIAPLLDGIDDHDPMIGDQARVALASLTRREAIDELCRRVVEDDDGRAEAIALASGYTPRDDHQRALFFFVTGQWERYEALDFDGRLLRASYEAAGPSLRARVREHLRGAGRGDFLRVVGGSDYRSRAAVMTQDEAEFLVQMLASHREWARLWAFIFELPFVWGVKVLPILAASGWTPEAADDRATFEELRRLTAESLPGWDEALGRALPPASKRAQVRVSGEVNDVAFSPAAPRIAVALRRRRVVLWDFQKAERVQLYGGFAHAIGRVAFDRRGNLLCAERSTKPTEACAIYACGVGKKGHRKVGEHLGAVTAIEPVGDGLLLSTGRDGRVVLWDVETGAVVSEAMVADGGGSADAWARAARVSGDGKAAAVLYNGLSLIQLPDLTVVSSLAWPGTLRCAAFAPEDRGLVVGKFSGEVFVCDRGPARLDPRVRGFCRHAGQVQGIEVLDERAVVVTAGSDGEVLFTSWANAATVGRLAVAGQRLNSLRVSPDGAFMALGDSDATMSLWDLRVLDVPLLLARPFAKAVPIHLAAVRVLAADDQLPPRALDSLRFAERVLRHRFRYDIEIDEVPEIRPGAYDIEVA